MRKISFNPRKSVTQVPLILKIRNTADVHILEKRYIKFHKGRHTFEISQQDDPDFPEYVKQKLENNTHFNFNQQYIQQLAILCSKNDISSRKAVSTPMWDFSIFLLKESWNVGRNINTTNINIEQILDKVSIQHLNDQIIQMSKIQFDNNIQKFSHIKYCSLVCDAGTVLKSHNLHFMIGYFDEPVQKIIYESYTGDTFDSEFYFKCFSDVFLKLQAHSIHICSVTSDNLPC